ncbi:MAG: arginine kinase [Desulfamplus sp.]|nr:arginine kinase [Desulfamplus sp.]MBF0258251.1 arginine kinase [Desulfamplus sp.]
MILLPPFPCFSADSISLAKRFLTNKIYEQLVHLKTGYGFTLHDALRSGIENPDSSIGIYAGDPESYDLFSAIFKPVIEKYHATETTSCHMKSDLSPVDFPDPDPAHEFILSTRIRVARNLTNFPFMPLISSADRKKVEEIITQLLENIESPFKGYYKSVKDCLGFTDQEQLARPIPSRSCFRKGDRFQESAGINRDWPDCRGVFESIDHKFSVWINEEDHIRVISIDRNGDIASVFNRLAKALDIIEKTLDCKQIDFAWKDDLGYLTACPSNLGTGMRAGVHIRLPKFFKQKEILENEAKKLKLQIRGTQGEKTEVESAVFDISNSQRLGLTERECCNILYNGVCKIIKLERQL